MNNGDSKEIEKLIESYLENQIQNQKETSNIQITTTITVNGEEYEGDGRS